MKLNDYLTTTAVAVAVLQFVVAPYVAARTRTRDISTTQNVVGPYSSMGRAFLTTVFLSGVLLHAFALAAWSLGLRGPGYSRQVLGIAGLSVAIAILIAVDAYSVSRSVRDRSETPSSFWALVYVALGERKALTVLGLLIIAGTAITTFYLVRALFTVEYESSGIVIRLPGQTVQYVPIYPQTTWQNTGIVLEEGEEGRVELVGMVSPGAIGLVGMTDLQNTMKRYHEAIKQMRSGHTRQDTVVANAAAADLTRADSNNTWTYTPPSGYDTAWYSGNNMPAFIRHNEVYGPEPFYYKQDNGLTVRGMPHNRVIAMILAHGAPRSSDGAHPGYDYSDKGMADSLIDLSRSVNEYPIRLKAQRSGWLWVVINDDDNVRWDNSGLFILKLTRSSRLKPS